MFQWNNRKRGFDHAFQKKKNLIFYQSEKANIF